MVRPRSCRVIYYFDTPALRRRHQSFGCVTLRRKRDDFSSPPKPATTLAAVAPPLAKKLSSKPPLHVPPWILECEGSWRVEREPKTWREEEDRRPVRTIEEREKNWEGEEENH